jgi:hypothetical protein
LQIESDVFDLQGWENYPLCFFERIGRPVLAALGMWSDEKVNRLKGLAACLIVRRCDRLS